MDIYSSAAVCACQILLSDFTLAVCYRPSWEYLYRGNWHTWTDGFVNCAFKNELEKMSVQIKLKSVAFWDFPGNASNKEPACQCRRHKRCGFDPVEEGMATRSSILVWRMDRGVWQAIYSPWGHKEWDTTEVTQHVVCSSVNSTGDWIQIQSIGIRGFKTNNPHSAKK